MFRKAQPKQPEVKLAVDVVGVTPVKAGQLIQTRYSSGWKDDVAGGPRTIVLYTVDGVMNTKVFSGTWTLTEAKHWKWTIK